MWALYYPVSENGHNLRGIGINNDDLFTKGDFWIWKITIQLYKKISLPIEILCLSIILSTFHLFSSSQQWRTLKCWAIPDVSFSSLKNSWQSYFIPVYCTHFLCFTNHSQRHHVFYSLSVWMGCDWQKADPNILEKKKQKW